MTSSKHSNLADEERRALFCRSLTLSPSPALCLVLIRGDQTSGWAGQSDLGETRSRSWQVTVVLVLDGLPLSFLCSSLRHSSCVFVPPRFVKLRFCLALITADNWVCVCGWVCVCVRVYARVSTAAAKKTWILIALNHFGLDCRWFVNFNLFISPLLLISSSFNDIYVYMYIHIFSGISAATASVWVRLPVIPIVIDSMNSCTCESQDDEGGERRGKATAGERSMPTESGDLSFPRMIVP